MIKCEACGDFITFLQQFNKFNNSGARILDSIEHMTLKAT